MNRRNFLQNSAIASGAAMLPMSCASSRFSNSNPFEISLAQWSLHRMLRSKKLSALDFPAFTNDTFGIKAVEYVNAFFKDKADDETFLTDLKMRCDDRDMRSVLIMCDGEGHLGDPDTKKRRQAVNNHHKWVRAAKFLGCHSIRVNAHSRGPKDEQSKFSTEGLRMLSEYAAKVNISVIVENHGGWSSDADWLMKTITATGMKNCGTLPDFGNFGKNDRYASTRKMMPRATGVSAKAHAFLENGEEKSSDFQRLMDIVHTSGYRGYVGIEFEGGGGEVTGIKKTQALLNKCFAKYTR